MDQLITSIYQQLKDYRAEENANVHITTESIATWISQFDKGLCFTWRNVPNNTPLVFWNPGGGFHPLFKVKRGLSAKAMFAEFFTK